MDLNSFLKKLRAISESAAIKANVSRLLYRKDNEIIKLLQEHSPYDPTNPDPHFKDQWKAHRKLFSGLSGSSSVLAELIISNKTPDYGRFLVEGADPGKAPWYYPGRNVKGQFTKGTGKLKVVDGKVWAGGLNPGHSKTVGGPIAQVLSKFSDKFSQEVADEVVKGFI